MGVAVTRFLTFPGSRITIEGSVEACDRAELMMSHLGLTGNEEEDRKKIDRLISSYKKTSVDFPYIKYEKK